MKSMGYGRGYKYAHDFEGGVANQVHMPEKLKGRKVYKPGRETNRKAGQPIEFSRSWLTRLVIFKPDASYRLAARAGHLGLAVHRARLEDRIPGLVPAAGRRSSRATTTF